jgi:hypothetical protein
LKSKIKEIFRDTKEHPNILMLGTSAPRCLVLFYILRFVKLFIKPWESVARAICKQFDKNKGIFLRILRVLKC